MGRPEVGAKCCLLRPFRRVAGVSRSKQGYLAVSAALRRDPRFQKIFPRAAQSCSRLPTAPASNRHPLSGCSTPLSAVPYSILFSGPLCVGARTQTRVKLHKTRFSLGLSLGKSLGGVSGLKNISVFGDLVFKTRRSHPLPFPPLLAEPDDLYLWNLVLFDQNLTGINRFLCLGPSREEWETPESLSLQPFILGNEESNEDSSYPTVAGVEGLTTQQACPFSPGQ